LLIGERGELIKANAVDWESPVQARFAIKAFKLFFSLHISWNFENSSQIAQSVAEQQYQLTLLLKTKAFA
jgi:hypothetical protein